MKCRESYCSPQFENSLGKNVHEPFIIKTKPPEKQTVKQLLALTQHTQLNVQPPLMPPLEKLTAQYERLFTSQ